MKRLAFVMTSLNTGGIATSIENLFNELNLQENLEIDLILFHSKTEDKTLVPKNVQIIPGGRVAELIAISQSQSKSFGLGYSLLRFFLGGVCKIFGHGLAYKIICANSYKYGGYDVAISCSQSGPINSLYGGCNEFVLNNIKAKKKIAFIHCDYATYGINDAYSHRIYSQFDKIAAVSKSVKKIFTDEEPALTDKTCIVYNCNNIDRIISLSKEDSYIYDSDVLNFVTVARIRKEKGHMRVIKALRNLKDKNVLFKWHIIGGYREDAPEELLLSIDEYNLLDCIEFHGNQKNPYRLMVNADFLLVPSYHEAAPMVFDEACILNLPIVTTNTVSAIEIVRDKCIGFVCDNTDYGLLEALEKVALTPELLKQYKENTYKYKYSNRIPLEQFMELIGKNS